MSQSRNPASQLWRRPRRRGISFLAFLAAALFLLVPVCTALQTAHAHAGDHAYAGPAQDHSGAELCCTSLSGGSMLPPAAAATFTANPPPGDLAAPAAQVARMFIPAAFVGTRDPPRSAPRSLPYHARTARILA
jgi:hypothetical protein